MKLIPHNFFFLLLGLALAPGLVRAASLTDVGLPTTPTSYVTDAARVLSATDRANLETQITQLRQATGAEIAVATIETLGDNTLEETAVRVFQTWGIGKAKADNGLLILLAKAERKVRIEVGYGLEPVITDLASKQIINDYFIPAFRTGDYGGGLQSGLAALGQLISTGEVPPLESPPTNPNRSWLDILSHLGFYIF